MRKKRFDTIGLYEVIEKHRTTIGLTKRELARRAGISAFVFSRLAKGKDVNIHSLAAICSILRIGIDRFTSRHESTEIALAARRMPEISSRLRDCSRSIGLISFPIANISDGGLGTDEADMIAIARMIRLADASCTQCREIIGKLEDMVGILGKLQKQGEGDE